MSYVQKRYAATVMTSTLIAAGNPLYGRGIAYALETASLTVAAIVKEPREVIPALRRLRPRLAILDVAIGGAGSLLRPVRFGFPALTIVTVGERAWAPIALRNGANGFVVGDVDEDAFADGVRRVLASTEFTVVGGGPPGDLEHSPLSAREHEVVAAAARGLTNKQIAAELSVTEQTVKFHLGNAFRKLGVTNRAQAAVAALRFTGV